MVNETKEQLQLAQNPNTPGEKLEELATLGESEILAAIASNPNSSPKLLVDLARDYLEEIGENSALDLTLLENLNFTHFNFSSNIRFRFPLNLKSERKSSNN